MTLRVLVVDDNPDHRFLTRRALASLAGRLDVAAEAAAGGAEALARLHEAGGARVDLVLLDLKMPGMDGFEVLQALRADPRTRDVRVVLFSSTEQHADKARARAAGADDVVTKPIGAERFQACVRETVLAWSARIGERA